MVTDGNLDSMKDWRDYMEGITELGEYGRPHLSDPDDPVLQQELFRHIHLLLSQTYGALAYQDESYPDFWPQFSSMNNYAVDNADDVYSLATIDARGLYRITGYRGTSRIVDLQIGQDTFFTKGIGPLKPALSNHDFDKELTLGTDGKFELILSAERPADYSGDWLYLDPEAKYICIRQIFYDWEAEGPGRFAIERMDLPAKQSRRSVEKMSLQMQDIVPSVRNWLDFGFGVTKSLNERQIVNRLEKSHFSDDAGGVSSQLYANGLYDLELDEALVIEMTIPKKCRYWGIVVYDEFWRIPGDWMHRSSAFNGHNAFTNIDGKVRAVVAAQDPGVPNWLDNSGYQHGGVFARFKECEGNPTTFSKKVKLTDLSDYLPKDTPSISREQRDKMIRLRRQAYQLRNR